MATITSAGSGLWSAAGTWDAGVPVDDDIVIITAGHVVEFDVDQSAFAVGIQGITINGTLKLTRSAGTYYLKLKAAKSIGGTGTFDCGTVGDRIPFSVKFTLLFSGAGCTITNGVTLNVYGQNPTYKQVRLTADAIVGATVLLVDTDLTGDIWADGDTIGIDTEVVGGVAKNEDKIIAVGGITSNSITLTVGLTYKKDVGDYVTLMTRHLRMQGVANSWSFKSTSVVHGAWFSAGMGGWLVGSSAMGLGDCVYSIASYGFYNTPGARITTGIWRGIVNLFHSCTGASLEGGYIGNCTPVFGGGAGHSMSGGVIFGCTYVFLTCPSIVITGGYIYGAWNTFINSNVVGYGFTFGASAYALTSTVFTFYGAVIASFNNGYSSLRKEFYSQWFDHQGIAGAYMAWCAGGVTTKQSAIKPTGETHSMQTVLESATKEGFFQKEIVVGAGASVNITLWLRKNASMAYLPRAIIFDKTTTDPFAGGAGIHTLTMTDSIDIWESDLYTYTNTTTEDITLIIRCQGMNATGSLYSLVDVEQINVDLTGAIALLNEVKTKTDQFIFTVPNQVDANALTGGGGATAEDVRAEMDSNSTKLADILVDTGTTIPDIINIIQSDLDNPDQFKADVSALALEATLTAMKGAGWTNETFVALMTAITSGGLSEEVIRSAIGLASANLDTQLGAVQEDLDNPDQFKTDVSEIPQLVWTYPIRQLTMTPEGILSTVIDGTISQVRGDTWQFNLTPIILSSNKQQLVIKKTYLDKDEDALLIVDSVAGLIRLNGSTEGFEAADASLKLIDVLLEFKVKAAITAQLPIGSHNYGIQGISADGIVNEPYQGIYEILKDFARLTT